MKVSMISDRAMDVACLTGCVSCCGGRAELLGRHPSQFAAGNDVGRSAWPVDMSEVSQTRKP